MKSGTDIILPASLAGGAAVLSILTGIFSGVSLGVIFLRGILIALAAMGFVLAAGWIIRKFLPELAEFSTASDTDGSASQSQTGNTVNIVMPPEGPAENGSSQGYSDERGSRSSMDDELPELDSPDSEIAENREKMHNNKPEASDIGSTVVSRGINLDILPSLDTLELGGESASAVEELDSEDDDTVEVSHSHKEVNVGGSHDPAEIAKAVKTVLKRDQQE